MEPPPLDVDGENIPKLCSTQEQEDRVSGPDDDQFDKNFSSPTPVKTKEPPRIRSKLDFTQLPPKFEALVEFFDRMITSLRLLSLRRKTPSFHYISRQLEILTGRKFLFMHLAQIKYLLPEAVQIDKVLIHDETTKCMKPDINITLDFDIVKDDQDGSMFLALSSLFLSRLKHFYIAHPQDNLPEAELPEPFGQRSTIITGDTISEDSSTLCENGKINSSHFPPNFKKSFYQEANAATIVKSDHFSPVKSPCDGNLQSNAGMESTKSLPTISVDTVESMGESTPVKLVAGNISVSVETPIQSTPARPILLTTSVLTCEDSSKMNASQKSTQSCSSAKKSLDFSVGNQDTIFSLKQASVCLSELVLLIHQIFQSVNFRSITKEELIQKIIMNQFEIDDHGDVEMKIEQLEKLIPDWFCKKLAPSGDLTFKVKKVSDLDSVCERVSGI